MSETELVLFILWLPIGAVIGWVVGTWIGENW